MRSHSRNSHRRSSRRSSHRSSRACVSNSCCATSEQEQNLCYHCTRESRKSKCSCCCCRRLKCKPSNECNFKCQDKNSKPLNVHLKLQLLNDHNQNKKSECLCAKYFQMLNTYYGGPPFCQNLCGQVDYEDKQMREKPCFLKLMKKKCSFFNFKKPNHNIEQPYPGRSSMQQQDAVQVQKVVEHVDGETQTDTKLPCTCQDYVEKILSTDKTPTIQTETDREQDTTMHRINSTLNEITDTLQTIETQLKRPSELQTPQTENVRFSIPKASITPTIVSFLTKCVPPPPLLTLSKLSYFHNPSPTIPTFLPQKTPKTNLSCEELFKLFNFDGRYSFDSNTNHCVPKQDYNLNKGHVYTKEATFQTNNDHDTL